MGLIVSQSWNPSGSPAPVRPDRTRPDENFIRPDETGFLPVHPAERNRISAGFLPDFCQFDVKNEPDGFQPDRTGWKKPVRFQLCCELMSTIFIPDPHISFFF
jgi:hypothetical protein